MVQAMQQLRGTSTGTEFRTLRLRLVQSRQALRTQLTRVSPNSSNMTVLSAACGAAEAHATPPRVDVWVVDCRDDPHRDVKSVQFVAARCAVVCGFFECFGKARLLRGPRPVSSSASHPGSMPAWRRLSR